jgi:hypothetical protein
MDLDQLAATYLSIVTAPSIYYTQTVADDTFLTKTNASTLYVSYDVLNESYYTADYIESMFLPKTNAAEYYLTKSDAQDEYLSIELAGKSYYTKTQTDSAIAAAIANIPGVGPSQGIRLNITRWSRCWPPDFVSDIPPKKSIKFCFGCLFMTEAVSDPNAAVILGCFDDNWTYKEAVCNWVCDDASKLYAKNCNRFFVMDDLRVVCWCKGEPTFNNKNFHWNMSRDTRSIPWTIWLNSDSSYFNAYYQMSANNSYPKFAKSCFVRTQPLTVIFFQYLGWVNTETFNFTFMPEGRSPIEIRAVDGKYSRFFLCLAHYLDDDVDAQIVYFWNPDINPTGIPTTYTKCRIQSVVTCARLVSSNTAALLYQNGKVELWQEPGQGLTPVVIWNTTIDAVDTVWKKLHLHNNLICAVADSAKGHSYAWTAQNPTNPTGAILTQILGSYGNIAKTKVVCDNLFILYESGVLEYGSTPYDAMSSNSKWRRVFLPTHENGGQWENWLNCKITAGDGRIYVNSSMYLYYADLFDSSGSSYVFNTTVTHNAPLGHGMNINDFEIGAPVFMTGSVFKFNDIKRIYETTTNVIDCIPSVKNTGGPREYLGICCGKIKRGEMKNIGQDTVEFASHGDVYFKVEDSSGYEIGDVVLIDKTILGEDIVVTGLIRRMIVGKVTARIDKNTLALFMD